MSEAAMQQDHRRPGPVRGIPDSSCLMFDVAMIVGDRQRGGTVRFKLLEIVVVNFHFYLRQSLWAQEAVASDSSTPVAHERASHFVYLPTSRGSHRWVSGSIATS